jgi:hypothetical protein
MEDPILRGRSSKMLTVAQPPAGLTRALVCLWPAPRMSGRRPTHRSGIPHNSCSRPTIFCTADPGFHNQETAVVDYTNGKVVANRPDRQRGRRARLRSCENRLHVLTVGHRVIGRFATRSATCREEGGSVTTLKPIVQRSVPGPSTPPFSLTCPSPYP